MGATFGTAFTECRIGESKFCVIDDDNTFHFRQRIAKDEEQEKQKLLNNNNNNTEKETPKGPHQNTVYNEDIDGEKVMPTFDSKKLLENLNNTPTLHDTQDFSEVKLVGLSSTMGEGQDFIIPEGMDGSTILTGEISENRNRSITPLNDNIDSNTESLVSNNLSNDNNNNNNNNPNIINIITTDNNSSNIENTPEEDEVTQDTPEATPDTIVEEPIPQDLYINLNDNNNLIQNNNINNSNEDNNIINDRSMSIEERNEKRNSQILLAPENKNDQYSMKSVQEMQDLLNDYQNQMSIVDLHRQQLSKSELANIKKNSDLDTSTGNDDESESDDDSSDTDDSTSSNRGRRGTNNVTSLNAPHIEIRQQSIEEMEMQLEALKLQNSLRDQNQLLRNQNSFKDQN